ncbi:hypothetical protein F53441_11399 [Fusarium austroafricanum]|uniref:Transcription factor domain-containing protein n=1 Tax=Fusarium austroafricanum TaxID=2364996 RepID=A0A8H4K6U0_9HYPO|nr:hypothetical protein F53441_11399 [Fusarium austroafricanum]
MWLLRDEVIEDTISNRQIMDRLDEIKEMLQQDCNSPRRFSDAERLHTTTEPSQTPAAAGSPWARFSAGAQYQAQNSTQVQSTEIERLPFAALRCESLLRWPALRHIVPSDARDIDSFPLSPGYKESSVQTSNSSGKGINESSFVPLCRRFLAHVHPRNPVLDGHQLISHARAAEENGLKWDSSSCIVLLSCALAEYTGTWIKPNAYSVPPTQEQLQQRDDLDQGPRAEPYYVAAQKRMGLLGSAIEDIQCFVLATIFEKSAFRPLRAWYYVQQACSRLETHLRQRGEKPRAPFRESNPKDYHLEQRLFWTCFRAERDGEEYWMKNPSYLIRQHRESEQQIMQWHYHLPVAVQFENGTIPAEEFASALEGRATLWQEYTLRPILYYVLHHQHDDTVPLQVHALALKELEICAKMVHRLAFQGRHGGTWLISRKIFLSACLILAAVTNSHRIQPPEQWHAIIELAMQTLERWAADAADVRRMADILRHMYRQI